MDEVSINFHNSNNNNNIHYHITFYNKIKINEVTA